MDNKGIKKVTIRPLFIKNGLNYQLTEQVGSQAIHKNFDENTCLEWLKEHLYNYKQTFLYTKTADHQILMTKKQQITLLNRPASKSTANLVHNRMKQYALEEGKPIPFMVHLGLMTEKGKINPKKSDKFRQINRFLEMIDDILVHFDKNKKIHIVDFGCGKAYLTFALHYYLKFIKKLDVFIVGLDLKVDVIKSCQDLAIQLNYTKDLLFQLGDIRTYHNQQEMDMVIALHACDIATDAAIEKAVKWKAKVILCAPCCQHELYSQVNNAMLNPLLKHGILKERFAALATDALRAQLLEVVGYQTQVLEFIDMEHTPKNLLIRAVRKTKVDNRQVEWQTYLKMKNELHVEPSLEKFLKQELP